MEVTFHSIIRGFVPPFDRIQRNAIRSWQQLGVDVLLFGAEEEGAIEVAQSLSLPTPHRLRLDDRGVPLVRYPIERARELARYEMRCLINADIVMWYEFEPVVESVAERFFRFLVVGRRWCAKVTEDLTFGTEWVLQLFSDGRLDNLDRIDWFLYRGDWLRDMPKFAVGRGWWDHWIIWKALKENVPVIDATPFYCCVHQNHPRASHGDTVGRKWNEALFWSDVDHDVNIANATHRMTPSGLIQA